MRFLGLSVVAGAALVLGACGKGGDAAADSAKMADSIAAAAAAATPAAPAAAGTMSPVTGTIHEVKMITDPSGSRFDPATVVAKAGDGIKFTVVGVGPHNVAFDPAVVPAEGKAQLMANMTEQMGELSSKMLMAAGESYTISLGGMPAGTYAFFCTPHLAMNMKGTLTIQ